MALSGASLSARLETGHHILTPTFHVGAPPAGPHLVITQSLFSLPEFCLQIRHLPPSQPSKPRGRGPLCHQADVETGLERLWSTFTTYEALGRWPRLLCLSLPVCTMGMIR